MRVTFLGTGSSQGIPVIGSTHPVCLSSDPKDKRLRSSVMIEWANYRYIIDCGPDFRQQMLTHKVNHIDGIVFTHEHSDHVAGFDEIRPFYFTKRNLPIYGAKRILESLKMRFHYFFGASKYPGAPSLDIHELSNKPFQLGNLEVNPIKVWHGRMPVFGYRFGDFTYITDAKTIPEEEIKKIKDTRVLVINALRKDPHPAHFNLEEALNFIEKVNPEQVYFTHISHWLGFHKEVEQELPNHISLAYDNLKIDI